MELYDYCFSIDRVFNIRGNLLEFIGSGASKVPVLFLSGGLSYVPPWHKFFNLNECGLAFSKEKCKKLISTESSPNMRSY